MRNIEDISSDDGERELPPDQDIGDALESAMRKFKKMSHLQEETTLMKEQEENLKQLQAKYNNAAKCLPQQESSGPYTKAREQEWKNLLLE